MKILGTDNWMNKKNPAIVVRAMNLSVYFGSELKRNHYWISQSGCPPRTISRHHLLKNYERG